MGMGDLRAVERNLSTNTSKQTSGPANNKSHGSKGMGDLKVIESKKTGNLTAPKSGASQPSQGMGDLKAAEFKKPDTNKSALAKFVLSTGADFIPVVGNIKSGVEAITGKDYITGEKLSNSARVMAAVGIVAGGVGKGVIKGIKAAGTVIKGTGKFIGDLHSLTPAEKKVVHDLLGQGKTVERIPESTIPNEKTPDFKVDGVKTELKSLENSNINTGITRIKKGFKQGAEVVIIDGRQAGLSKEQAQQIINRTKGTYTDKRLPGKVEIWTNDGVIKSEK